jgi:hypothetical protein
LILLRYLLVFFCFAFLLFLFFVPVYQYLFRFTLHSELTSIQNKLHGGAAIIDTTTSVLNNAVAHTSGDSRFRIFKFNPMATRTNPYLFTELQRALSGILLPHSLVADAGIIFSKDVILTRQRMFLYPGLYSFYTEFLSCGDLGWDEWIELLVSKGPFFGVHSYKSSDHGNYEALTFSAPWYHTEFPENNIFYATLPIRNLLPLITDDEILARGFVRILTMEGDLLLNYPENTRSGINEKYHILNDQSSAASLRFEIGVPESLINEKLRPVNKMIFLFALSAILGSLFLSLLFAYKSSKPMRNLLARIGETENVRSEYERHINSQKPGFLKSFRRIYSDLIESITAVDARLKYSLLTIESQTELLRTQMFDKALHRGIYKPEELSGFQSVFPGFFQRS